MPSVDFSLPSPFIPPGEKAFTSLIKPSMLSGPPASFPKPQAKQNVLLKAHFSKMTFSVDLQRHPTKTVGQQKWPDLFPTGFWFWEPKKVFSQSVLTGLCTCFSAWEPMTNLKCQLARSELSRLFIAGDFGQLILKSPLQDSGSHKFFIGFLNIFRHLVGWNGLNNCYVCMRENEKLLHWRKTQGHVEFLAPG